MIWTAESEQQLAAKFAEGWTYSELAEFYRTTRNAIAGRCHRLGLHREGKRQITRSRVEPKVIISAEEQAERETDLRDLEILHDIKDGHTHKQLAEYWGVSRTHIHKLEKARKEAN